MALPWSGDPTAGRHGFVVSVNHLALQLTTTYDWFATQRRRWLIAALLAPAGEIPDVISDYRTLSSPSNSGQASRYKLDFPRRLFLSVLDPP